MTVRRGSLWSGALAVAASAALVLPGSAAAVSPSTAPPPSTSSVTGTDPTGDVPDPDGDITRWTVRYETSADLVTSRVVIAYDLVGDGLGSSPNDGPAGVLRVADDPAYEYRIVDGYPGLAYVPFVERDGRLLCQVSNESGTGYAHALAIDAKCLGYPPAVGVQFRLLFTGSAGSQSDLFPDTGTAVVRAPQPVRAPGLGNPLLLDGFGGLHRLPSTLCDPQPCAYGVGPYWRGWDIARGVADLSRESALVLDGLGGLHLIQGPHDPAFSIGRGPYWGWDIARDVAYVPGVGAYVLDGYGGIHPVAVDGHTPPPVVAGAYWPGWDVARGLAVLDDGSGGYVVDAYGGLHPFTVAGGTTPPPVTSGPAWPGWDIVRDVELDLPSDNLPTPSTSTSGYVLDGYGGRHPFGTATSQPPASAPVGPYWRGWDIARSFS